MRTTSLNRALNSTSRHINRTIGIAIILRLTMSTSMTFRRFRIFTRSLRLNVIRMRSFKQVNLKPASRRNIHMFRQHALNNKNSTVLSLRGRRMTSGTRAFNHSLRTRLKVIRISIKPRFTYLIYHIDHSIRITILIRTHAYPIP